jgi:hypothetical protein
MKRDPEGVVPFIAVESILIRATALAYEAGRLNGAMMRHDETRSPNARISDGEPTP